LVSEKLEDTESGGLMLFKTAPAEWPAAARARPPALWTSRRALELFEFREPPVRLLAEQSGITGDNGFTGPLHVRHATIQGGDQFSELTLQFGCRQCHKWLLQEGLRRRGRRGAR
jgi:hypothetical protein